jgi:cysteine desulfurase / selenocysteine lyase
MDHPDVEMPAAWAREFALEAGLVYLNHAAVAPWPRCTAQAVARFARQNAQRGAADYPAWVRTQRELRERLARLIGAAAAEDVALAKNTSEALSMIAFGLPWRSGDNVVFAREEFPSNRIVWEALGARGVDARGVAIGGLDDPEAALLARMDARTRVLAVSSVQYGSGLRMDLARLGGECRRAGVLLCVDAIQSLGALRFDVLECAADFVVADGHKWMLGPEGVALLWCRPGLRETLALHEYGWHMTDVYDDFDAPVWRPAASARRFECGSPNMLGIHALHASLGLLERVGIEAVERAVLARTAWLHARLGESRRLRVLSDPRPTRRSGIVTFTRRGIAPVALVRALRAAGVIAAARGGGVRLSPHFYTPLQALENAVKLSETLEPV